MEQRCTKTPGKIALLISLFSLCLFIVALILTATETPPEMGPGKSFAFWTYFQIISMFSLIFYTIDAVLCIVEIFKKISPIFNLALAVVLIGAIPVGILILGRLGGYTFIWAVYYLIMSILEAISITKHNKPICTDIKETKENIEAKGKKQASFSHRQ